MSRYKLATSPVLHSFLGIHVSLLGASAWHCRPDFLRSARSPTRGLTTTPRNHQEQQQRSTEQSRDIKDTSRGQGSSSSFASSESANSSDQSHPLDWDDDPDFSNITRFSDLPHAQFGHNQHIKVNEEFKESLRQILWSFRAPIRYAFAYGSGVFSQSTSNSPSSDALSPHPHPPKAVEDWQRNGHKIIDFIFGVSHTQHWHSLNLAQHPSHYSFLRHLPYSSAAISGIQDRLGAGVYFNPFITVNGTMIKYGVVNLDTLSSDLSEWQTLYLAGRLQKPVKILRDDPRVRLANQVNLLSALRTALLMLPESFTERQLYERIAGFSYLGDPRMNQAFSGENPNKVRNIVGAQLPGFRQLYTPLIDTLPNLTFTDPRTPHFQGWEKEDAIRHTGSAPALEGVLGGPEGLQLQQDMDPQKRGNMVRRLPKAFRKKLYFQYKSKFGIPGSAFDEVMEAAVDEDTTAGFKRRQGGDFERRIASEADLSKVVGSCVKKTVAWPATSQTVKSFFTAGPGKAWKYYAEKRGKSRETKKSAEEEASGKGKEKDEKSD